MFMGGFRDYVGQGRAENIDQELDATDGDKSEKGAQNFEFGFDLYFDKATDAAENLLVTAGDFVEKNENVDQRNKAEAMKLTTALKDLYRKASNLIENGDYEEADSVMGSLNTTLDSAMEGVKSRRYRIHAQDLIEDDKERRKEAVYSLGDFALNVKALEKKIQQEKSKKIIA